MTKNILLASYLVNKDIDLIIMGVVFTSFMVGMVIWVEYKDWTYRKKEPVPKMYWIDKVVKGDGEEQYHVKNNKHINYGNIIFDTLQDAIDRITELKKKDIASKELSREVVWTDSEPSRPEDRHIQQGEEPEEPEHIKYSRENASKNNGIYVDKQGSWRQLMVLNDDIETELPEGYSIKGGVMADDMVLREDIEPEYNAIKAMEEQIKNADPEYLKQYLVDPRTIQYLAHLEKKAISEMTRYEMCKDQPAQIDCRVTNCVFYMGSGTCSNVSPAITLNPHKTFVCWSMKEKVIQNTEKGYLDYLEQKDLSEKRNWFENGGDHLS